MIWRVGLFLLPGILSIFWLVASALGYESDFSWLLPAGSLFIAVLALLVRLLGWIQGRLTSTKARFSSMGRLALLAPCALAPTACAAPWVPSGWGFDGWQYFLHWLTKYPNAGPINIQVLLGILCVLGVLFAPLGFGLYGLLVRQPRVKHLSVLALLYLVPQLAVFIQLDVHLWMASLIDEIVFIALLGPILHLLPCVSLLGLLFQSSAFNSPENES